MIYPAAAILAFFGTIYCFFCILWSAGGGLFRQTSACSGENTKIHMANFRVSSFRALVIDDSGLAGAG